jgi:hypothetical protein
VEAKSKKNHVNEIDTRQSSICPQEALGLRLRTDALIVPKKQIGNCIAVWKNIVKADKTPSRMYSKLEQK